MVLTTMVVIAFAAMALVAVPAFASLRQVGHAPARPAEALGSGRTPRQPRPWRQHEQQAMQVLFSTHERTAVVVDAIALGEGWSTRVGVPRGSPMTFRLRVPRDFFVATAAANLLRRWADGHAVVDVSFRERGAEHGATRAQLSDGESRVMLDLDDLVLAGRS